MSFDGFTIFGIPVVMTVKDAIGIIIGVGFIALGLFLLAFSKVVGAARRWLYRRADNGKN